MTAQEIINKFFWLVDDTNTDNDQALELLNTSYDALMTERQWNFLRKTDASNTLSGSTVNITLPTDFMYPIKALRYDGTSYTEMTIVPYNERFRYNKLSNALYFDPLNSRLTLLQTPAEQNISGQTLTLVYQYQPAQLTTSDTPVFNRAFHSILSYEMAKFFAYNDQQEKNRSFNREFEGEYQTLKDKMVMWDAKFEFGVSPDFVPPESWVNFN
jgi:hypothetical protein